MILININIEPEMNQENIIAASNIKILINELTKR